ncbi:hypothetical protein BFC19_01375 [Brochothrix thermosphacta]|uniref:SdpA family antimicrobial peptide system protein n=1 Tax=Brochothrix thermosphacta TaxID=2756 RepID=UPI000E765F1E|nr:SdpA family antimicrobial peptide system protein [Brochothrix thermosphacta]ANZ94176.1 hypothetical protein BFC19_01375 [Brochothrix thermosphacta]
MTKQFILFVSLILLYSVLYLYALMPVTAKNPISQLPFGKMIKTQQWFPQGWGFYSKDPRDITFQVVSIKTGKQAVSWPNNRASNWFGLKRYGRAQGIETGLLQENLLSKDWHTNGRAFNRIEKINPYQIEKFNSFPNNYRRHWFY